jgi:hypothetical protein
MTEAERRAFVAGYRFAAWAMIDATVPLVSIIAALMWKAWGEASADHVELTSLVEREWATFAEVHRLRDCGEVAALEFFERERAMEVER